MSRLANARLGLRRLFNEWFAAVHYARKGYRVLLGKYQFPKAQPEKARVFRQFAPPRVIDLLLESRPYGRRQGPDLFVYRPSGHWMFVETKSPGERLTPKQIELFKAIERRSRPTEIVVARVVTAADT